MSVGVATLPDVAASAEQLIHAADEAMYWVKEHGKNNVYVAAELTLPPRKNAKIGRNAGLEGRGMCMLRNNFESAFSVFTVLE